jgi:tRNA nucleotidyltransferase (CCA-adding enzyme)
MKKKLPPKRDFDTIITTHINADFDAMASMLAAQKLYPGALVVFPGASEKNIRNFFIKSMVYLYNMAEIKDLDLSHVKRMVIVDTRQPSRIGNLLPLVKKPGIDIHIYDHHPDMPDDIQGNYEEIRKTGSTVAILTGILKQKKIAITPEEATIMCLGIYEDTGSFTFSSTSEEDFQAAACLLSKGANLNTVSDLISKEISPQQLNVLNDMFNSISHYNINGVDIVITSITTDEYVPDLAFLVHKMIKMENYNAVFALACMGSKIYIVARSRIQEVDAAVVMKAMGGGGHQFAAAATVKDNTLTQTEHQLLKILHSSIKPHRQAKDLMSSPAIQVNANVTLKDASELLTRYNINALLVTDAQRNEIILKGYITRQVIEKAIYHQLDSSPVKDYMTSEVAVVNPTADLNEVQNKIIEHKQRVLPVIENHKIVGVITRTDLLNVLVRQTQKNQSRFPDPFKNSAPKRTKNVIKFIQERLSTRIIDLLKTIGKTADEMGVNAYVVGGFVRDLFLFRSNEDIDIVIEGDGISFAKKYAAMVNARIHSYEKFGTAVIIFEDGFKIDVASARLEYYKFPAALPIVEMGSIKLDLYRRDFTVNTLSIQLNTNRFGTLLDFFSAQKDLKEKAIRVLHNLSFVEDPTRVFRAIRFEQRFGFSIGKLTSGLVENAVKMDFFKRLSGRRVFSELRQILEEDNPTRAIIRLQDYDLLKVIHPSVKLDNDLISIFNAIKKVLSWYDLLFLNEPLMRWVVYFLALIRHCDDITSKEICTGFNQAPRHVHLCSVERFHAQKCMHRLEYRLPVKDSTLYKRLSGFKTELILYMMATTRHEQVKKAVSHYFTRLRKVTPIIKGRDLKALGIKPGPIYSKLLESVLAAKLDGRLKTKEDELQFVKQRMPASETIEKTIPTKA